MYDAPVIQRAGGLDEDGDLSESDETSKGSKMSADQLLHVDALKIIAEAKPADPDFQHRFMMAAADVGSSETLDGRLNPLRGAQRAMAVLLDRLAHDLQNSSRGAAPPATAPLSQRVAGAVRNVLRSFDLKRSKAPSDIEVSHAFCEAAFQAALLFGQPHAAVEPKLHKILDPVADLDTPAEPLTIRHAVVRLTALASQIESIKEPQSTFVFIDDVAPA